MMELNKALSGLKNQSPIAPREEEIQKTVQLGKTAFLLAEGENLMPPWEFLWTQFAMIRKRWWAVQGMLLLAAGYLLSQMENDFSRVRSVGVVGCLFVVFMVPELWRNRESESTQVEAACYYSLRRIYAARMTLFGLADIGLLTVFSAFLGRMGLSPVELISQLLLPAAVTAVICLFLLSRAVSETVSLAVSLSWSGLWWLVLMNERFYTLVAPGIWLALFALALALLVLGVRKTLESTNQYWEVPCYGIKTD